MALSDVSLISHCKVLLEKMRTCLTLSKVLRGSVVHPHLESKALRKKRDMGFFFRPSPSAEKKEKLISTWGQLCSISHLLNIYYMLGTELNVLHTPIHLTR